MRQERSRSHVFFPAPGHTGQVPIIDGFDVFLIGKVSEMNKAIQIVCVVAIVAALGSSAMAVNIEMAPVGNPGNAADTEVMHDGTTGYGAVGYAYNIGKYEVTTGQYSGFLNAIAGADTYGLYNPDMWSNVYGCKIQRSGSWGSYTYSVADDWANRPVNYVSWADAARFTNWLHNGQPNGAQNDSTTENGAYDLSTTQRYYGPNGETPTEKSADWYALNEILMGVSREPGWKWAIPTEDEWYKAAYHKNDGVTGNYYKYPTSNDAAPSNDLIDPDPGNNATYYNIYPLGEDPLTIGAPYYRTEVGAHENSDSPYGTFDQGGNVWEWTEAIITGYHRTYRLFRGASFGSSDVMRQRSRSRSVTGNPASEYYGYGFRVTEVPEPGTLSILALGGSAVLRRQRRRLERRKLTREDA